MMTSIVKTKQNYSTVFKTLLLGCALSSFALPSTGVAEPIYITDSQALFKLRYAQFPMQDASAPNEFTTGDAITMPRRTLDRSPLASTVFMSNPCIDRDVFLREAQDGGDPYLWSPLNSATVTATAPSGAQFRGIGYAPGAANADDCWGFVRRGGIPTQQVAELVVEDPIQTDDVPGFIPQSLLFPRGITSSGAPIIVTTSNCVFVTDANGNITCSTTPPPVTPPPVTPPPPTTSGPPPVAPPPVSEPGPLALLFGAGLFAYFRSKSYGRKDMTL